MLSVTGQMINILTEQNVRRSLAELKPRDILIEPELGDFSAGDFDNLTKTVPIGEAGARKVADRLRALSLPPEQYAALRARQGPASTDAMITVVDEIRVEGTQRINPQVVLQSMQTEVGKPIDRDTLDLDLRRIYGRGDFENVGYTVEEIDGKRVLTVRVKEKPETHYVRFGLELAADLGQRSYFNLFASHRAKGLNSFGAEWRNDVVLGRNVLLATEFYQPLSERQYFFVAPQLRYANKPLDLYVDDLLSAEYQDQSGVAQFDVGANFLQYGQARLGLAFGERRFSQQSGSVALPSSGTTNIRAAVFDLKLDQFAGVNFPTGGWGAAANLYSQLDALGGDNPYNSWRAGAGAAVSAGRHTFELGVVGGRQAGVEPDPDLRPVRTRRIPEAVGTGGRADPDAGLPVRPARIPHEARGHPAVRGHVLRRVAGGGPRAAVHSHLAGRVRRRQDHDSGGSPVRRHRLAAGAAVPRLRLLEPGPLRRVPVPRPTIGLVNAWAGACAEPGATGPSRRCASRPGAAARSRRSCGRSRA